MRSDRTELSSIERALAQALVRALVAELRAEAIDQDEDPVTATAAPKKNAARGQRAAAVGAHQKVHSDESISGYSKSA